MKENRFLMPVLTACLFIFSRFLLPRVTTVSFAPAILDLVWCAAACRWFLKKKNTFHFHKPVHPLVPTGLLLLFLGIILCGNRYIPATAPTENTFIGITDLVLLGPVAEEWVFRGLPLAPCRKERPAVIWFTVLLSSLLFAVSHSRSIQMLCAFGFSLMAFCLLWFSSSMVWPVVFHILANALGLLLPRPPIWLCVSVLLTACVLLYAAFCIYAPRKKKGRSRNRNA